MDVTIVMPVRNREGIVGRTLRSLELQSFRPLSVILVDNGSTDGTRAALESWANKVSSPDFNVTIIDEPIPGAARARNAGLDKVVTEWTMFFDSDDEMLPDHVDRAMNCAKKHPKAELIGWDVKAILPSGKEKICPFFSSDMMYNNILHGGFATLRYMARTALFRKAKGWNADFGVWDDIELGARILSLNPAPRMFKVNGVPRVITHFTHESLTGESWSGKAAELCAAIDKIELQLPKSMRWIANLKRAQVARVCRKENRPDLAKAIVGKISCSPWQRPLFRLASYLPSDLLRPFF
ncbi:MAG: glycosyltransferase family 2 protein [Clostridium sp.]|nr:glycosyltransferase family 2 protein [Clostridium sp.]